MPVRPVRPERKAEASAPVPKKVAPVASTTKKLSLDEVTASVSYEISITKKTGDFEFIKVTAGVVLPLGFTPEMLDAVDDQLIVVRDKIAGRLEKDLGTLDI